MRKTEFPNQELRTQWLRIKSLIDVKSGALRGPHSFALTCPLPWCRERELACLNIYTLIFLLFIILDSGWGVSSVTQHPPGKRKVVSLIFGTKTNKQTKNMPWIQAKINNIKKSKNKEKGNSVKRDECKSD